MSTTWLKNLIGVKQSEFELLRVPNPRLEYCLQVTLRTTEVGTVVGSLIGPLLAFITETEKPNGANMKEAFKQGGIYGALFGLAIGPLISFYSLKQISRLRLYDKCYRHRQV